MQSGSPSAKHTGFFFFLGIDQVPPVIRKEPFLRGRKACSIFFSAFITQVFVLRDLPERHSKQKCRSDPGSTLSLGGCRRGGEKG